MGKKVQLTVTGCQWDESNEEIVTKTLTEAEYYEKNGAFFLFYEEHLEGTDCPVKNTIKLRNSLLELTKRGGVNTRMVFEPGKEYPADYATPYGCLKIGISTRSVECIFSENRLEIQAEYSLLSGGSPFSRCKLTIAAQTEEPTIG